MMTHSVKFVVCCFAILISLTSCQLAVEDAGEIASDDRLAGYFVTTEYLDLFDFDGYLNDNINSFSGGELIVDTDAQKYQGRLYGTLTTETLTSEETGETAVIDKYIFEGIEGIPFFAATISVPEEQYSYRTFITGDEISGGHTGVHTGDSEDNTTLEGVVYVTSSNIIRTTYYFNPVYQRADGSVYLTAGSGMTYSSDIGGEGERYSQTMEDTYTVTENGITKTENISVKLSVSVMHKPEKIIILQMDDNSNLLARIEYAPGALPDTFVPEPDAAYLVVETHKRDTAGGAIIERDIYGNDADEIETFAARADGVCIKSWTQIEWPR